MARTISESDWKLFRRIHSLARERFCTRAIAEVNAVVASTREDNHTRFLEVAKMVDRLDRELGELFDDLRRSTAWFQLARIQAQGLVTETELAEFSAETREVLAVLLGTESV